MALANLGFEDPDATPGSADLWTISVTTAAEIVATWGSEVPPLDEDGFEIEWNNDDYLFAFELADTDPILFDEDVGDGEALEDFEEGWDDNETYFFELGTASDAEFDVANELEEDFEHEWDSNESYSFTLGTSTAASFDAALTPQAFEDFEDGWSGGGAGNDYDLTLGSTTLAAWNGAFNDPEEQFETDYTPLQCTVVPGTDLFTSSGAHGFTAGDLVTFYVPGAGVLPAGIASVYEYYVIASGLTGTTFRVSVASGGVTVDVTDAGIGAFYARQDPRQYWNLEP